ncbi:hypothetical protein QTP88_026887 [Uroleucon formosanum]
MSLRFERHIFRSFSNGIPCVSKILGVELPFHQLRSLYRKNNDKKRQTFSTAAGDINTLRSSPDAVTSERRDERKWEIMRADPKHLRWDFSYNTFSQTTCFRTNLILYYTKLRIADLEGNLNSFKHV